MRLRTFIPFVSLIVVLLVAACAPTTPVIPQTGPDTQGGTAGDASGAGGSGTTGGTGTDQSGQGGTGTGQSGAGGTGDTGAGTGSGQGGTGGTQGGSTSGTGGFNGGGQSGQTGGNTAPSPSMAQFDLDQNVRNSISGFAAQEFGGNASDVEVVWAQQVDFQNGCLDVANQGENCTQTVTPGWQVVVRSNGNLYVLHTNSNGSNVRVNQNADPNLLVGQGGASGSQGGSTGGTGSNQGGSTGGTGGSGSTGGNTGGTGGSQGGTSAGNTGGTGSNQGGSTSGNQGGSTGGNTGGSGGSNQGGGVGGDGLRVSLDQVINLASQFLGQTLNVPLNQVGFTSVTVENWPDSCLGLGQGNANCTQVTTPGYRLGFTVGGTNYELRTDSTGSNIRLVQGGQQ